MLSEAISRFGAIIKNVAHIVNSKYLYSARTMTISCKLLGCICICITADQSTGISCARFVRTNSSKITSLLHASIRYRANERFRYEMLVSCKSVKLENCTISDTWLQICTRSTPHTGQLCRVDSLTLCPILARGVSKRPRHRIRTTLLPYHSVCDLGVGPSSSSFIIVIVALDSRSRCSWRLIGGFRRLWREGSSAGCFPANI